MRRYPLIALVLLFLLSLAGWAVDTSGPAMSVLILVAGLVGWLAAPSAAPGEKRVAPRPADAGQDPVAQIMDLFEEPLLLTDRNVVRHANPAALGLIGDHVINEDIRVAIRHPAAADRLAGRLQGDLAPVELVGLGERDRHWEMAVRMLDEDRRLVILRDRTDVHAVEKIRVDFVANASHELRTPLATLLGFIETLMDEGPGNDPATRQRFLGIMGGEARRMERLVDDLISLSRIEADKFSAPQQIVALPALAKTVASSIEAGASQSRIMFNIADDVRDVLGDFSQLSQLLHNLMGNAVKYGRAGTPVTVTIENAANRMVKLAVADEGEGIAPHHLPRLTERFYRVDPGRSKKLGGTGLGLAIVKHIVERHRGRLDIRSNVGLGTTVAISLPQAPSSK